ncbi:MAG TPA: FadR/GntR family transcriptional regulator [Polyangia bacterium]|nr:FadR/GntR family transcriptional regulator [Polyangia bacterium]
MAAHPQTPNPNPSSPPTGVRRFYRQVADQLRALIADGNYGPGSRLPPERDIAVQLNVSRTTVREALIALELAGLVEVRGGSGVYVLARPQAQGLIIDTGDGGPGPFELLQARRVLEGEIAAMAADAIDDTGLANLEETIRQLERSGHSLPEREAADRQFHVALAEATRNSVLIQTVRLYWDMRRGPMWSRIVEHFHTPALLQAVVADHRAILSACKEHSSAAARRSMHRHLRRVEREFQQSWNEGLDLSTSGSWGDETADGERETPAPTAVPGGGEKNRAS